MLNSLLIKILPMILSAASPVIKQAICAFVDELEKKAKATPNGVDDILASLARDILCPK